MEKYDERQEVLDAFRNPNFLNKAIVVEGISNMPAADELPGEQKCQEK